MTNMQDGAVKFFLGRSLFLGMGISLIFKFAGSDAWISGILGILIGIVLIYIVSYINLDIDNLHDYLQKKNIVNNLIKIMLFMFYLFYIFLMINILATFLFSYYLPFTPSVLTLLPFLILGSWLANKGIKNIGRVSIMLIFISLLLMLFAFILLGGYIEFENFLPVFINSNTNIFMGAFIFAIASVSPFLVTLGDKKTFKHNIKVYLFNSLLTLLIIFYIAGTFGNTMSRVFSYPEYAILRKIQLSNFIEHIENIVMLIWFFDMFISISYALNKTREIIKNKEMITLIALALVILSSVFIMPDYININILYKSSPFILIGFVGLTCLLFLVKKMSNKKKRSKAS